MRHRAAAIALAARFESSVWVKTMRPEQIYQDLMELAEKLGITVSEQNFRPAGINVNSGFCRVKNKDMFYIDKHADLNRKIEILATFVSELEHEKVYVIPAIRELLYRYRQTGFPSPKL